MAEEMVKQSTLVAEKRPYLGKDERRRLLLSVASELVEQHGWAVLNMSAVADHAGVSRQLVYQHFPNLESLLGATAQTVFEETMENTQQAILKHPDDLKKAIRAAELVSLDLPQGRGDALWQLIAGVNSSSPELEFIRQGIRDVILGLWVPPVMKARRIKESSARSLVWMVVMSFWGVRQLIRDGLVSKKQGIQAFDKVLDAVL